MSLHREKTHPIIVLLRTQMHRSKLNHMCISNNRIQKQVAISTQMLKRNNLSLLLSRKEAGVKEKLLKYWCEYLALVENENMVEYNRKTVSCLKLK